MPLYRRLNSADLTSAFTEGVIAYENGTDITASPYIYDSRILHEQWIAGWREGEHHEDIDMLTQDCDELPDFLHEV
jgi:ribosome modulation factor